MSKHRDALTGRIKKIKSPISWDISKILLWNRVQTLTEPGLDVVFYQLLDELVDPIKCLDEKSLVAQINKILFFSTRYSEHLPTPILNLLNKHKNHYSDRLRLPDMNATDTNMPLITLVMQDGTHLSISCETADAMTGRNRPHHTGNHQVQGYRGIHCKMSSLLPIQPGGEQAAASLIGQFSQQMIVAPSMIIKLLGNVSGDMSSSSQAEPASHHQLIQASYSIDGVSLLDVLMLQHVFNKLNILLSHDELTQFIGIISNFSENFVDVEELPEPEALLYEYKNLFPTLNEKLFLELFREMYVKYGRPYLEKTLYLLKAFSFISEGLDFEEAVYCLYLFETVATHIFQHKHCSVFIEQIPLLLELLNQEATSGLFLGLLFSLPEDARLNNIMFTVDERDNDGRIIQAHLVVFDDDDSLRIPTSSSVKYLDGKKTIPTFINIYMKNALLFIESLMQKTISLKTIELFMSKKPIEWMLTWLIQLGHQHQEIHNLMEKNILTQSDIANGDGGNPLLLPYQIQSGVLTYIYQLMHKLRICFNLNQQPTFADIFSFTLPIIWAHCTHIKNEKQRLTGQPMSVFSIQEVLQRSSCFTITFGESAKLNDSWESFLQHSPDWINLNCDMTIFQNERRTMNKLNATELKPLSLAISEFMANIGFSKTFEYDKTTSELLCDLKTLLPDIVSIALVEKPAIPVASSSSPSTPSNRPRSHSSLIRDTTKFYSAPTISTMRGPTSPITIAQAIPTLHRNLSQSYVPDSTSPLQRREHRLRGHSFIAPNQVPSSEAPEELSKRFR